MRVLSVVSMLSLVAGCASTAKSVQSEGSSEQAAAASQQHPAEPDKGCGLVRVRFDTDKAAIKKDDQGKLDLSAECLKTNRRLRVSINGNADDRGAQAYNQKLGLERAASVQGYLEAKGVAAEQIDTVSFGEERPLCTQNDKECWQRNRRVSIVPVCKM